MLLNLMKMNGENLLMSKFSLLISINCFLFIYFSMKYVRALQYVLENAPVRAKDPETKVCVINLAFFLSDT